MTPLNAGGRASSEHFRFLLDMSSRGVVAFGRGQNGTTNTLSSTTAAQKLFNWSPNGALRLGIGEYLFRSQLYIDSMSATSGNGQLLLGGTAAIDISMSHVWGVDQTSIASVATLSGSAALGMTGEANAVTPSVGTRMLVTWQGHFAVETPGTIIPQIALTTAAAAVVANRSWFLVERVAESRFYGDWI
jgi:hypothetical protein